MAKAARLKVFCAPSGFDDALVAAPSQKAALAAWGARSDLFALGAAHVVTDPQLAAEALARPGEVIRRPRGDLAALLAAAPKPKAGAPAVPERVAGAKAAPALRPAPPPAPRPKPPPDRSALDAADVALASAQWEQGAALAELARERAALDAREARLHREGEARLDELARTRDRARKAYVRAGGDA